MHPQITSHTPGICPICHMQLQKVEDDGEQSADTPTQIPGRATFNLSNERQQLIGVTTAKVALQPLDLEVRASGRVAFDPDLFTAIEEYRQTILSSKEMTSLALREDSKALVASSRTKLKLMGLTEDQIKQLGTKRADPMNLLLPKGSAWIYAEVFEYEAASVNVGIVATDEEYHRGRIRRE